MDAPALTPTLSRKRERGATSLEKKRRWARPRQRCASAATHIAPEPKPRDRGRAQRSRRRPYGKAGSRRPPATLGSFNRPFNAPPTVAHPRGRQSSFVRKQSPVRKPQGPLR
ncbi:hypothetical protein CBM2592_B110088 [Cupriavidus taiwanensis]|nr:hypothetical protein CBM2592_B110088 [Cupriavidus taiwanensis]SOY63605.1 hypothetical protein CBM2588_B140083 [Cupriavidus taiwanensis]SOY93754.1 hypothetical protein CBM2591_B100061 [Cupriavidus taiwanensis]SOZ85433.1 hypothetical protein CBM2618_B130174 [Cupriavidus taiwanensis]SOZ88807.1 hypothetical protein CBM2622_B140176 [Cupriavidus taiwanensis]